MCTTVRSREHPGLEPAEAESDVCGEKISSQPRLQSEQPSIQRCRG